MEEESTTEQRPPVSSAFLFLYSSSPTKPILNNSSNLFNSSAILEYLFKDKLYESDKFVVWNNNNGVKFFVRFFYEKTCRNTRIFQYCGDWDIMKITEEYIFCVSKFQFLYFKLLIKFSHAFFFVKLQHHQKQRETWKTS